jgi:DNA-binding transcriptional LysR family regulator
MTVNSTELGSNEVFCKAAELESFAACARNLGITAAAVSRSISRLELRLGVRVFNRTTRQVKLTDDGRTYYEQCKQALEQIQNAEQALTGKQKSPGGRLRISVPTTYGHARLMPLLPRFMAAYPKIDVDVDISNRNIDFIEDGFDLAIRLGELQDSRLVARTLEHASVGVFASPTYLRKNGTPKTLAQLQDHECFAFVLPSTGRALPWIFNAPEPIDYQPRGRLRFHGDVLGAVHVAVAAGGLVQTYHYIAQDFIERGLLKEVLKPFAGRSRPFSILYPQNRHLSAKVRVFVDFLISHVNR